MKKRVLLVLMSCFSGLFAQDKYKKDLVKIKNKSKGAVLVSILYKKGGKAPMSYALPGIVCSIPLRPQGLKAIEIWNDHNSKKLAFLETEKRNASFNYSAGKLTEK